MSKRTKAKTQTLEPPLTRAQRLAIMNQPFPIVRIVAPRTWAGANVGEKMRQGNAEGRVENYTYDTFR